MQVKPTIRAMIKGGKTKEEADCRCRKRSPEYHASFTNDVVMEFYNKQIRTVDVGRAPSRKQSKVHQDYEDQALHNFDSQLENKNERSVKAYVRKKDSSTYSMTSRSDSGPARPDPDPNEPSCNRRPGSL
jgi:hypothetical protein